MSECSPHKFGPLRSFFWPVHGWEVRKILPMMLMLFLICLNYSILRNAKDALVITASGAEVIPFIKVWAMLPMAVFLTCVFTILSNRFSQEKVFYIIVSAFLISYALFAFVLYPLRDFIHPHAAADYLTQTLPTGFHGLISMFRYWSFTLFYVMSELWSSIVLTVLFWGFANEVTRMHEASRFYSVFGIASNIAAITAGQTSIFFTQGVYNTALPFGRDAWEQSLMMLVMLVLMSGIGTMIIFRWMNRNVLNDPAFDDLHQAKKAIKAKGKLSMKDSFIYLSKSKYLLCIAMIVIGYNLVINLVEVVWKDQLRTVYSTPSDFNEYMSNLTSAIGFLSLITALSMAKIISRFGWTRTALITPVTMLVTCIGFFSFLFFKESLGGIAAFFGTTPIVIAVSFGTLQNCLSKSAKYSVFDATKEMAFIPLSPECKLKGKAAIDGVGSRLGKSGGSLIHQGLLMIFSTLTVSAPYVAAILMVAIMLWMLAIRSLGVKFNEITDPKPAAKAEADAEWAQGGLEGPLPRPAS